VIVLDASALVELILATPLGRRVADLLSDPAEGIHAPHLADVEVTQVLRRYVREGSIDSDEAALAIADYCALDLQRHPHEPLLERVWALRDNLSAYDAVYAALAEVLDATLVTCDGRISRAPGLAARIALIESDRP
jgi:predicted nucleic acid-binding protein